MESLTTKTFSISGMTCVHCQNTIEKTLKGTKGIKSVKVSFSTSLATVVFDSNVIYFSKIKKIIENLDYGVESASSAGKPGKKEGVIRFIITMVVLFILYQTLRMFGGLDFFNSFPQATQGMGYGILFLLGLLTSVHCVAMCGGINISQCVPMKNNDKSKLASLRPGILYNSGRVISYTVIGGIVGSIGSVISFPGMAKGIIAILAGIFMVIMGLNMLSLFPSLRKFNIRMPKIFTRRINDEKKSNNPFYVGLLNGLMPCGPLQAMQLYALSTGSPLKGALSMLFFSLGTVPLMFGLGAISSFLSKTFTSRIKVVSAALVVMLGVVMFGNGMSLSGFNVPSFSNQNAIKSTLVDNSSMTQSQSGDPGNIQLINTSLDGGDYSAITVKSGVPVKWTISAKKSDINGCNNTLVIPKYNIKKKLAPGDNIIEFTPGGSGKIPYSCWMGMITSTITIVD